LITLILVLAFSALYVSKSLGKKPEPLALVVDKMNAHINDVAFYGSIWGAAAAVITLGSHFGLGALLVRLAANVAICIMALPYIIDRLVTKYQGKINTVILEEAKNLVAWVSKNEKIIGYIGAACGVALFFVVFK
jgi:hypothetical protein